MSDKNLAVVFAAVSTAPELRYTPNGNAVLELSLSGENPIYGKPGEFARFYENVSFLGQTAENLADTLKVGDVVLVEGQLDYSEWTGKVSGKKEDKLRVRGQKISFSIGDFQFGQDQKGQPYLKGQGFVRVSASGNLTHQPSGRYTTTGSFVMSCSGAVTDSWKQGEEWKEKSNFVRISSFDASWENLIEGVDKGDRFFGEFDLRRGSYTDKEGVKRYTCDLHPRSLVLSKRKKAEGERTSSVTPRAPQNHGRVLDVLEEAMHPLDDGLPF